MAKKSMKDAAAAGTSVFEQIVSGNTQQAQPTEERKEIKEVISVPTAPDAQDIQDIKDVQNTPDTQMRRRGRKPNPDKQPIERLNLKIPAALKQYLIIAAARASLEQERQISITEYICDLIADDKSRQEEE